MALVDSIVVRCTRLDDYNTRIFISALAHGPFLCGIFLTFNPQRFFVTALVGEHVPSFSHVVCRVFVSGGAHLFHCTF